MVTVFLKKSINSFINEIRALSTSLFIIFISTLPNAHADVSLTKGWNLLGNSSAVTASTLLFTSDQVLSVWAWDNTSSTWKFFSPSTEFTDGGAAYAVKNGYKALTTVPAFQGFWVNASKDFVLPITATNSAASATSSLITPFINNTAFSNLPFFFWEQTVGGSYTGEIQSGFALLKSSSDVTVYGADDTYTMFQFSNRTQPTSLSSNSTGIIITDTFSLDTKTISCVLSSQITSIATMNGGLGFTQMDYQNLTGSSSNCDSNKTKMQTFYPLDGNFSVSDLKGKTLTVGQTCGTSINQITIATDSGGNFSIQGNICSIKQQNYFGAFNVRDVTNPKVANGAVANVGNFSGLLRLTPAGYNATMRAAKAPTMFLARSVDGLVYYFSLSYGASPGQLAGGMLYLVSLQ